VRCKERIKQFNTRSKIDYVTLVMLSPWDVAMQRILANFSGLSLFTVN